MKKYIYLVLLITSCYTAKKAVKDLDKVYNAYPEVVAKKTSEWYPCIPYQIKSDSSQYKSWLKSFDSINGLYFEMLSQIPDTFKLSIHDTLKEKCLDKKAIIKYREVIRNMPSIHDTVYKIDSAKNFILHKKADDCEVDRLDILKRYLKFKTYFIWALILLCISLLLNVLQYNFRR